MRFLGWVLSFACLSTLGCGQSADVVGDRNQVPPPPEDTGWTTDFEACATERVQASRIGTNLFLTVDTSCSMANPVDGDPDTSLWDAAASAFSGFFSDPSSESLDVALRLWPTSDGCDHNSCDADICAVPQVSLGSMSDPTHRQTLLDQLENTSPSGYTPMHAALDGAVRWASAQQAAAPDEQVAIVLVTDGEPNGCDEDIDNIAGLAATAASAGIPVFAVGIEGSNPDQIDQIAAAGNTGAGFFVGSAAAEADLRAALEAIQGQVLSCSYTFPETSTDGSPLSPDLVRVVVEIDGETTLVGRVRDASACAAGGWYLDDPAQPSTITLCPSTCTEMQEIADVALDIDVGCVCVSDDDCPGDDVCAPEGCVTPCEGPDCIDTAVPPDAVRGFQAVQGGAFNCAAAPVPASLVFGLVGLLAVGVRRRTRWEAP